MMYYARLDVSTEYMPVDMFFLNEAEIEACIAEAAENDCKVEVLDLVPFKVTGKTYHDRKNSLRDLAVMFSNADCEFTSWDSIIDIQHFFRENGRRYGLLREFEENAIC